jgi:single-strand DNA-binding protein
MSGSLTAYQIGRLSEDPVAKTAGGTNLVEMRLVSSQGKGDKEKTQWVKAAFFGKQADLVKDLKKGDMIAVQGPLHARAWSTKSGEARCDLELTVNSFTFIGGKTTDKTAGGEGAPF